MTAYTLIDRNYNSFLEEVELLFIEKIKNIIEDINLKETYDFVETLIKDDESKNRIIFSSGNKFLKLIETAIDNEILICCKKCNEEDIIELLDSTNPIYTLKIVDRICYRGLSIHFDENASNIMFSYKFLEEHKYVLIKNYKIITDTFNDYNYILWLLSIVGDTLFEFSDD